MLENPEISVQRQIELYFFSRGSPLFPFGTERRKFPRHFSIFFQFPVSHQPKTIIVHHIADGIRTILFSWFVMLGISLPLLKGRPNQFVLTNGKHLNSHTVNTTQPQCLHSTRPIRLHTRPIIKAILCIFTVHLNSYLSFLSHKLTISSPNVSISISAHDS